jgi:hypothetical protein
MVTPERGHPAIGSEFSTKAMSQFGLMAVFGGFWRDLAVLAPRFSRAPGNSFNMATAAHPTERNLTGFIGCPT